MPSTSEEKEKRLLVFKLIKHFHIQFQARDLSLPPIIYPCTSLRHLPTCNNFFRNIMDSSQVESTNQASGQITGFVQQLTKLANLSQPPRKIMEASEVKSANKASGQITVFAQPCDPQTPSRLSQLPPELRLKIWRLLHKHEKPLGSGSILPIVENFYHNDDTADLSMIELSGQALGCCQMLRNEMWSILYGENTVVITCKAGGCHECDFSILNTTRELLPTNMEDMFPDCPYGSLKTFLEHFMFDTDMANRELYRVQRFLGGLSNIRKVEMTVVYEDRTMMFRACKFFQAFLQDKDVDFIPRCINSDLQDTELECLRSCGILRCRSITFASDLDLAWLVDEIVGQEPVKDLLPRWEQVYQILDELPHDGNFWKDTSDPAVEDLEAAVAQLDVTELERLIPELMQHVTVWIETALDRMGTEAKQRNKRRLTELMEKVRTELQSD